MKDSLFFGTIIGSIAPLLAFALNSYTALQALYFADKPIALFVVAAGINLVIMRFTYRAGKENLAKGIMLITFLAMLVLILGQRFKIY
ncbi:hypothetical protein ACL9RF_14625 [Sphingobacterium sp. Mn56C]|uniref:hypothetical protein n=1 Tax=Sphingobacterium sp. Mn56C TaxID=3395261 RepID=UPI003BEBB834